MFWLLQKLWETLIDARLAQGHAAAVRLTRAPVDVKVKEFLWRTRIIPKITWGWWLSEVPTAVQNKVLQISAKPQLCTRWLRNICVCYSMDMHSHSLL